MAQPSGSDIHIDIPLTNMSVSYLQDPGNFVAGKVFPNLNVDRQSDKYFVFTKNDFLRDQAQARAPLTESEGSGYTLSNTTYYCDVFALHKDISDQDRANTNMPLDPDRNAVQFLTQAMLQRQENQFATDAMATSVWGTDSTPSNLWDNYGTSDPITDIETGKATILQNTGFEPNTLVMAYTVFRYLRRHPDIIDLLKYTDGPSARNVTAQMLAGIFDLDRVLVTKAVTATNKENETAAYSFTVGKHALLCYTPPSPALETPSAGYTFTWTGIPVSGGLGTNIGTYRIPMPLKRGERIESQMAWDNKIVGTDLGYFFNGAVS